MKNRFPLWEGGFFVLGFLYFYMMNVVMLRLAGIIEQGNVVINESKGRITGMKGVIDERMGVIGCFRTIMMKKRLMFVFLRARTILENVEVSNRGVEGRN